MSAIEEDQQETTKEAGDELRSKPIRNAFSELMASKGREASISSTASTARQKSYDRTGKGALAAYTVKPEEYSKSVVISYSDDFVVIHDMFPKSSVHTLLLPRDPAKLILHPFEAFEDPIFLAAVKVAVSDLKKTVASELRRLYGRYSATELARNAALDADDPPAVLPSGRDWEMDVIAGVHAHPSMTHLHIHVLSVDRVSDCMKHRKHYNSFATPFFVPVEDFPLAVDDVRRHPGRQGYLQREFVCWRCGKRFGSAFKKLKEHLHDEFIAWRAE